jgi:hypothetical protein
MRYVIPAVITLIVTVGVVICIRMVLNAGKQKISRRKAKRDQKLIRDLHRQTIADAVDDPNSRQMAYKLTDHYLDD